MPGHPPGTVNEAPTFEFVSAARPDAVLLFGSSIVKAPLLDHFANRTLNMHLGLSPYYRGGATNFWPLVNGQPECVGTTLHYATLKVDAGPILHQVRPNASPSDGSHDLGCKAVIAGAIGMLDVLRAFANGRAQGVIQDVTRGRVYRRRDFTPDAVETMRANFDAGMMPAYLGAKPSRDAAFPLVTL